MYDTLADQMEAAVIALAGHGALKDRLALAYSKHLADIDPDDLPEEVQQDFAELARTMHAARALPGDDVVRASARKLSNDEAQRCAALVVRVYGLRVHREATAVRSANRAAAALRASTPLAALLALEGGGEPRSKRTSEA